MRAGIEKAGMTVSTEPRAEVAAFMTSESATYKTIIGEAGVREE